MKVECPSKRCSIKNMRAKRQSSLPAGVGVGESVPSPLSATSEKKSKPKWPPQKRQSSGSSDDNNALAVNTHRPPKLFFARRLSKDSSGKEDAPPLSPPPLSPRSPGVKVVKLCLSPAARRAYEEALVLQQRQQQAQLQQQLQLQKGNNSRGTSTSTLVDSHAAPGVEVDSPAPARRQSSLDTLVDEPAGVAEEVTSASGKQRTAMQLPVTDQQLMLIVVVLAVSQCILLARLRAGAM